METNYKVGFGDLEDILTEKAKKIILEKAKEVIKDECINEEEIESIEFDVLNDWIRMGIEEKDCEVYDVYVIKFFHLF